MQILVAVGGPGPTLPTDWDFWLPSYVILSLILMLAVFRLRFSARTCVAAFVLGTLWAWLDDPLGVVPASASVALVVVLAAGFRGRKGRRAPER